MSNFFYDYRETTWPCGTVGHKLAEAYKQASENLSLCSKNSPGMCSERSLRFTEVKGETDTSHSK